VCVCVCVFEGRKNVSGSAVVRTVQVLFIRRRPMIRIASSCDTCSKSSDKRRNTAWRNIRHKCLVESATKNCNRDDLRPVPNPMDQLPTNRPACYWPIAEDLTPIAAAVRRCIFAVRSRPCCRTADHTASPLRARSL
jgi:hypothetical protein